VGTVGSTTRGLVGRYCFSVLLFVLGRAFGKDLGGNEYVVLSQCSFGGDGDVGFGAVLQRVGNDALRVANLDSGLVGSELKAVFAGRIALHEGAFDEDAFDADTSSFQVGFGNELVHGGSPDRGPFEGEG